MACQWATSILLNNKNNNLFTSVERDFKGSTGSVTDAGD